MDSTINRRFLLLAAACLWGLNGCAGSGRGEALAPHGFDALPAAAVAWSEDAGRGIEVPLLFEAGALYVATTDRRIVQYDPDTGRRRWRKRIDGSATGSLTLHDGTLFAGTSVPDGSAYMFDLGKKKVRWRHEVGEVTGSAFFFEGAVLLATRDGRVFGLSPHEGRPIWVTNLNADVWGPPVLDRENALFLVPGRNGEVFAVDARSGEKRWSADVGSALCGIAALGKRVAAASVDGRLDFLDAVTGNRLWKAELGMRVTSRPEWSGSRIVMAGLDGSVAAVDTADGSTAWRVALGGPFRATAAGDGAVVAVAAASGLVWVLRAETGEVVARVRHPETVSVPPVPAGGLWIVAGDRGRIVAYDFAALPGDPEAGERP